MKRGGRCGGAAFATGRGAARRAAGASFHLRDHVKFLAAAHAALAPARGLLRGYSGGVHRFAPHFSGRHVGAGAAASHAVCAREVGSVTTECVFTVLTGVATERLSKVRPAGVQRAFPAARVYAELAEPAFALFGRLARRNLP